MTTAKLLATLPSLAEASYRQFAASLIPDEQDLIGVRLPKLHKLARQAAGENWHRLFKELKGITCMECVMLRGMLPGYANNVPIEQRLEALADFVPDIRNWSICDSCCVTWKFAREHRERTFRFLHPYLRSQKEFEARFGVVMLLNHYLSDEIWLPKVAAELPQIPAQGFYARMAIAWCSCEVLLNCPELTREHLSALSPDIRELTLRKLRESRRSVHLSL